MSPPFYWPVLKEILLISIETLTLFLLNPRTLLLIFKLISRKVMQAILL